MGDATLLGKENYGIGGNRLKGEKKVSTGRLADITNLQQRPKLLIKDPKCSNQLPLALTNTSRNSKSNLPSVRQYIETFAINIYLKFPALVVEQLVPMLRDYDMRAQALSCYVFIAASVILHASKVHQFNHLDDLLPPIIPLLTSHHHSLRGFTFTQVLVHQVLHKLFLPWDPTSSETMPLEKRCFEDLKSYLAKNSDCARLRASMEGYLDAFDPNTSSTPAGIFVSRVEEEIGFECVTVVYQAKVSCEVYVNTKNQTVVRQDCSPAVRNSSS